MSFIPLCQDTLYAVFPKGHPLSAYNIVSIDQLCEEPFVLPSNGTLRDIAYLLGNFQPKIHRFMDTISDMSALALVQNGLGISIFPGILLKNTSLERVEVRRIKTCKYHTLGLASYEKRHLSPAVKGFQLFLKIGV